MLLVSLALHVPAATKPPVALLHVGCTSTCAARRAAWCVLWCAAACTVWRVSALAWCVVRAKMLTRARGVVCVRVHARTVWRVDYVCARRVHGLQVRVAWRGVVRVSCGCEEGVAL